MELQHPYFIKHPEGLKWSHCWELVHSIVIWPLSSLWENVDSWQQQRDSLVNNEWEEGVLMAGPLEVPIRSLGLHFILESSMRGRGLGSCFLTSRGSCAAWTSHSGSRSFPPSFRAGLKQSPSSGESVDPGVRFSVVGKPRNLGRHFNLSQRRLPHSESGELKP